MNEFHPLDQFNFHHTLEATPGPSIVLFSAPDCGACRRFRQLLSEYLSSFGDASVFIVDVEQDLALAREYDVFHLPALFLFVDGDYHRPLQCEARMEDLREALIRALAQPALEAP